MEGNPFKYGQVSSRKIDLVALIMGARGSHGDELMAVECTARAFDRRIFLSRPSSSSCL